MLPRLAPDVLLDTAIPAYATSVTSAADSDVRYGPDEARPLRHFRPRPVSIGEEGDPGRPTCHPEPGLAVAVLSPKMTDLRGQGPAGNLGAI